MIRRPRAPRTSLMRIPWRSRSETCEPNAVAGRMALLTLVLAACAVLPFTPAALAQTTCTTTSTAVTGFTGDLARLVDDCNTLLEDIKDDLGGTALNWAETVAMDTWDGITVSGTPPRVINLLLSSKSLTGIIPAALGGLTSLRQLHLQTNQLTGPIPAELGDLTSLRQLHLHTNQLTGAIPPELGGLNNLLRLYLTNNNLSGAIPAALGGLESLETSCSPGRFRPSWGS